MNKQIIGHYFLLVKHNYNIQNAGSLIALMRVA
jgi:hypothetical protein